MANNEHTFDFIRTTLEISTMQRTCRLVALVLALFAMPVFAQQTTFTFDLDAAQVAGGASTSTAVGKAFVTLDAGDLVTITVHHNVPGASLITLETGAPGVSGVIYNLFNITASPAKASMTLFAPADAVSMLADGFYIQIYGPGGISPIIRGQITNGFPGQVFISEWCNDPVPPAQSVGIDTNLDGVLATSGSQSNDEFVEIVNATDSPILLDNWTFADGAAIRHTFPVGTLLQSGEAITLFGGGNLQTFQNFGLQAQAANGGTFALGLNNGGDTMTLADSFGTIIDQVTYVSQGPGDSDGESVSKIPESPLGTPTRSTTLPLNPVHSSGRRSGNIFPWLDTALPVAAYIGNGTDAAIEVSINSVLDTQPSNQHNVVGGDIVQLRYYSPNMQLNNLPFLAVAQPFPTGFPAPTSSFIGDPIPTIIYSGALPTYILADGLTFPFAPFAPVLGSFVHSGLIPMSVSGTGTSFMILLIAFDPGRNSQDLGNAEAHELIVQ